MKRVAFSATPNTASFRALNYRPEIERLRNNSGAKRLGDLVCDFAPAQGSRFARIDCNREHGVQQLSQVDMFAIEPSGVWLRRDSFPHPERHLVRKWQILIAGAGQMQEANLLGRAIIADDRLAGSYVGGDAINLSFTEEGEDDNLWAYAFLCTSTGLAAVRSAAYGTSIPRLRLDLLADVPIPTADDATRTRVAKLVREAVESRGRFMEALTSARRVVEETPVFKESVAICAERRRRHLAWSGSLPTLCAWNYASTGGATEYLLQKCSGRLGDVVPADGLFRGPRFARVDVDAPYGIEFMSQRDVFLIKPAPRRISHPGVNSSQLFALRETILVGAQGTLGEGEIFGRCQYIATPSSSTAYTEHLLRIQPQHKYAGGLFAFLSTVVGLRLMRSTAVGTKLLSLRTDLLRALPIPDLTSDQITSINRFLQRADYDRHRAEAAEGEAIRIIEEEVLPQWLE